jgi:hypothetical protein
MMLSGPGASSNGSLRWLGALLFQLLDAVRFGLGRALFLCRPSLHQAGLERMLL